MLESFFNVFPSTLYHGLCFKMRRTIPFKYKLIAKTIEFISMVQRKMCNLYSEGSKFSEKVMASAVKKIMLSMVKPEKVSVSLSFLGGMGSKGASYLKHLRDDLIPAVEAMHPNIYFTFVQDSAPSHHANQVQNFLKQKLKSRFVKNTDWSPKFPDCNPLDYYFWD